MLDSFFSAISFLDDNIKTILINIDKAYLKDIEEIRLRAQQPLCLYIKGVLYFVDNNSHLDRNITGAFCVTKEQLEITVRRLTGNSVYSHSQEILNGFISLPFGNRAGIVGVFKEGKFVCASSVNIRIAHQIFGVARDVITNYFGGSLLICGPPTSGKTTFLRDLIRGVSNGEAGKHYKVSVIDTRYEIAAAINGVPQMDIGINTDVFSGREKAVGIEAAIRSMSPEIIAFDEIGTTAELDAVKSSMNCGAYIFTTAHISDIYSLEKRNVTKSLLYECAIDRVIFLQFAGASPLVFNVKEGKICF